MRVFRIVISVTPHACKCHLNKMQRAMTQKAGGRDKWGEKFLYKVAVFKPEKIERARFVDSM